MSNNICPSCSHKILGQNVFCTNCGKKLSDEEQNGRCLMVLTNDQSSILFPLNKKTTLIGRNLRNAIVINDDQISNYHAAIVIEDKAIWIQDLESKNGVHVNGKVISERAPLHDGSLIKLGNTILRYKEENETEF